MKITDSDEFRQLFYDFRRFAIDINNFAQNIYMVFRKNNLRNVWLGNIGYIVDRLTSIQNFVKENTQWSLEYNIDYKINANEFLREKLEQVTIMKCDLEKQLKHNK